MKQISKQFLSAMLAMIMFVTMLPTGAFTASATGAVVQSSYATGDIITYGSYPQTKVTDVGLISTLNAQTLQGNNTVTYGGSRYKRVYFSEYTYFNQSGGNYPQADNGYYTNTIYWFKYEPIKWQVLSNNSDELFLISENILDVKRYSSTDYTWENSTIRRWLNTEFYDEAFSSEEKQQIRNSTVINPDYNIEDMGEYGWVVKGGKNTIDRLFLISHEEAFNKNYGLGSSGNSEVDRTSCAKETAYSESQGNGAFWCLRTFGIVEWGEKGRFAYCHGDYTPGSGSGIRPAMKISLKTYSTTSAVTTTSSFSTQQLISTFDFNAPNDMWGFEHKNVANYDLSKKYFDHLCSRGPWTQNVYISYKLNSLRLWWRGSCHGMSLASILFKNDKLHPSRWQKNANSINVLNVDNSRDIITYYQFLQYTNGHRNYLADFGRNTQQEKLKQLVTLASQYPITGKPVLVELNWGGGYVGHSVVACGVEYGDFTQDGFNYQLRVKTYDVNTAEGTLDTTQRNANRVEIAKSYIYLADADNNGLFDAWTCPKYFGKNAGSLIGATSDIDIINEYNIEEIDLQDKHSDIQIEQKNATMTITDSNDIEGKIVSGQAASYVKGLEVSGDIPLYTYFDINSPANDPDVFSTLNIVLPESNSEYRFDTEGKIKPIDVTMMYPDCLSRAYAEKGKAVSFNPDGSATMQMNGGKYKLGITMDNALTFLPCQTISVEGRDSKVITIQNHEGALLVSGDNLKDLAVLVLQPNFEEIALKVSTEKSNLLAKPKPGDNSGAIEVFISKNDDGVYDTKIAETGLVTSAETSTELASDNTAKAVSGKTIALASIVTAAAIGAGVVLIIIIKKKKKP